MMTMDGFWPEKVAGFEFPSLRGGEAHVLAVDDSLVDRKVIERLLKIYSCKVTAVDSGRRALQFLGLDEEMEDGSSVVAGLKVDLIITDYCMPGMTGYELLKKIKESSAFRETPVVIMSSENVLARIDRCLEEGAEDFFVKPVKLSDVERLKEHLTVKDTIATTTNKRKRPEDPDLRDSPTSSESPRSIASPESSPSSQSPTSTPSSPVSPRLKSTASSSDLMVAADSSPMSPRLKLTASSPDLMVVADSSPMSPRLKLTASSADLMVVADSLL